MVCRVALALTGLSSALRCALLADELRLRPVSQRAASAAGTRPASHLFARPRHSNPRGMRYTSSLIGHVDTVWPLGTVRRGCRRSGDNGYLYGPGRLRHEGRARPARIRIEGAPGARALCPSVTPVVLVKLGRGDRKRRSRAGTSRQPGAEPPARLCSSRPRARQRSLKTSRKGAERFEEWSSTVARRTRASKTGGRASARSSSSRTRCSSCSPSAIPSAEIRSTSARSTAASGAYVVAPEATALVDVRAPTEADGSCSSRGRSWCCEPARPRHDHHGEKLIRAVPADAPDRAQPHAFPTRPEARPASWASTSARRRSPEAPPMRT